MGGRIGPDNKSTWTPQLEELRSRLFRDMLQFVANKAIGGELANVSSSDEQQKNDNYQVPEDPFRKKR